MGSYDTYISGVDPASLSETLNKLAPNCPNCGEKMLRLCLEDCCRDEPLHCSQCNSRQHLTHRTNQLQLLFINKAHTLDKEKVRESARSIIELLTQYRQQSETIVEKQLQLIDIYSEEITKMERVLSALDKPNGVDELHEHLEEYFSRNLSLEETRKLFRRDITKVRLGYFEETNIDLSSILSYLDGKQADLVPNSSSEEADKYQELIEACAPYIHLLDFLRATSIQMQIYQLPFDNLMLGETLNRSRCLYYQDLLTQEHTFTGERCLRLCNDDETYIYEEDLYVEQQFDTIKELASESLWRVYPSHLVTLNLRLRYVPVRDDFLQDIPETVESLLISIPESYSYEAEVTVRATRYSRETTKLIVKTREANYRALVSDIVRLPNLRKLYVDFAYLPNKEILKLVRTAITRNMVYLSLALDEAETRLDGISLCNNMRSNTLHQAVALLRTRHLRHMSNIFVQELLKSLSKPVFETIIVAV